LCCRHVSSCRFLVLLRELRDWNLLSERRNGVCELLSWQVPGRHWVDELRELCCWHLREFKCKRLLRLCRGYNLRLVRLVVVHHMRCWPVRSDGFQRLQALYCRQLPERCWPRKLHVLRRWHFHVFRRRNRKQLH